MNSRLRYNKKVVYSLLAVSLLADYATIFIESMRYISYLCQGLIWVFMFPNIRIKNNTNIMFIILMLYLIVLSVSGILNGNYIKYILFDIHIYTSLIFITYFNNRNIQARNYNEIPLLISKYMYLGVPLAIIIFIKYGFIDASANVRDISISDEVKASIFIAPIIIAPILVPFVVDMNRLMKYVVILANAMVLTYGVMTSTRTYVVVALLAFGSLSKFRLRINKEMIYVVISLYMIFQGVYYSNNSWAIITQGKIENTIHRFENKYDYGNGRDSEVVGLFADFNVAEIVFGRGAGAEQEFGFWKNSTNNNYHGINYTHYGFLHLILKGGIVLLLLVYGLAIHSIFTLYKYGDRKYLFVILIFLTFELSHTLFLNYYYLIFLWLSISYALQLKTRRNYA